MEQQLQAIATILSLVNPVVCAAMFAQIESGKPRSTRLSEATKAAVAVLVILLLAALLGARVLELFGVSLQAFSIAGGVVLAWIGFGMLTGSTSQTQDPVNENGVQKRSLTPLILFAASPGTITGVITIALAQHDRGFPLAAVVAVVVATMLMWIAMVLLAGGGTHARNSFVRDTATRFMGLLIVAMGVQFAITGLRDFFATKP